MTGCRHSPAENQTKPTPPPPPSGSQASATTWKPPSSHKNHPQASRHACHSGCETASSAGKTSGSIRKVLPCARTGNDTWPKQPPPPFSSRPRIPRCRCWGPFCAYNAPPIRGAQMTGICCEWWGCLCCCRKRYKKRRWQPIPPPTGTLQRHLFHKI